MHQSTTITYKGMIQHDIDEISRVGEYVEMHKFGNEMSRHLQASINLGKNQN